eukprot:10619056-Lingulodinium_polyedra.AAC.1
MFRFSAPAPSGALDGCGPSSPVRAGAGSQGSTGGAQASWRPCLMSRPPGVRVPRCNRRRWRVAGRRAGRRLSAQAG